MRIPIILLACFVVGCVDAARPLHPGASSRELVATDTNAFSVSVYWVYDPPSDSYTFTAYPSGNTNPLTYTWIINNCPGNVDDLDCNFNRTFATGQSATTRLPKYWSGTKSSITAEAKENVDGGASGVGKAFIVLGAPPTSRSFACNATMDYLWPSQHYDPATHSFVTDSVTDNYNRTVVKMYRRAPCTGAKVFNF